MTDAQFRPHGRHLIAGAWVDTPDHFSSSPAEGPAFEFSAGNAALVDDACRAAAAAFDAYASTSIESRAAFLNAIADEIESRAAAITWIGSRETGLPPGRLDGERARTTGQLRLFARHILGRTHLDERIDAAQPERSPLPRPELRLIQRPIGPVAVFGASNFPLAFSTAGGDTAAALAAGCPVVVKGHSAHPGTSEIVAEAILAAQKSAGMPDGVFSLIQAGSRVVGEALVTHPAIKAVGFTGGLFGGRALFDLCAARPEPIPFFGELGSVNPMFVLPSALDGRAEGLGAGWAGSLSMGAGQFCTNPGIAFLIDGPAADRFIAAAHAALEAIAPQTMLTDGIATAWSRGTAQMAATPGVRTLLNSGASGRNSAPALFETDAETFLATHHLHEEVFGPTALVVRLPSEDAMLSVARNFSGQLTATVHIEEADRDLATSLARILEHKAGRLLVNGFPTGVEVCDAMVHGGPYPASTNFGATSVGTMSIRRFLRPVCYQNAPEWMLP
ncbi:aldehyde dehydrogenase (NADP(+)) [Neorhizobium alkalisoli]|uniref:NADP-dependent aldehyde dehydrogenase n=1 Tax=Neorhizobium alkalisoli TaxID=528178 RepID=A0A561QAS1_9HYPH|nr:aldehyde dehydrogenase (NADP(+)) [Neorhizobium alkalisoli]TWF47463.1 NADP-dependent aldehyde dehydrogenase [Neorhizobium alkalisoli]